MLAMMLIAVFAVVVVDMVAGGVAAGGGVDKVLRTDDEKCELFSRFVCCVDCVFVLLMCADLFVCRSFAC